MNENWCAFCLVVCKPISVDEALKIMHIERKKSTEAKCKYPVDLILKIFDLVSNGRTHKEIGAIVGLTKDQVSGIIRTHKGLAARKPTKVFHAAI